MRHHMTLLHDPDHQALTTDATLTITTPEGKQVTVLPFRLGPTHSQPRREVQAIVQRPTSVPTPIPSMPPGTPISMQSQLKKMQPPTMSSVRIPSSGSMRPPAPPTMPAISTHVSQPTAEVPSDTSSHTLPEVNTSPQDAAPQSQPETQTQPQSEPFVPTPTSAPPIRPPSQNQQSTTVGLNLPVITNSYHIPVAGFPAAIPNNTSLPYSGQTSNVLSAQQMQNIKMAFAEQTPAMHQLQPATGNILSRVPAQYIGHVNGVNFDHLQVRQLHWPPQRIPTNGLNGTTVTQPNGYTGAFQQGTVNGIRTNGIAVGHVVGQHSPSPLLQSTSPVPNGSMHGSPPRPSSQSSVASSPSMQTQTVGVNGRYS
jgi:enhancer of polycomb-like protein